MSKETTFIMLRNYTSHKLFRKLVYVLIITVFALLMFKPLQANLFNLDLGDENDNFATGQWVNKGKVIYKDFFLQHQPNPTLISAFIQKTDDLNTTFLLIKRHREFVFFFSIVFLILLSLRFGIIALVSGLFLEVSKFTLLGNLFLAESLVVYPVIYLILLVYDVYFKKQETIHYLELVFVIFLMAFIGFNLAPLAVFVLFIFVLLMLKLDNLKKKQFLILTLLIGSFHILFYSAFISIGDYLYQTVYINIFKFIPFESTYHKFSKISVFILPIQTIFFENNSFYLLLKVVSGSYIISLLMLGYLRKWKIAVFSYLLLVSLNLRPVGLGLFGAGFHYLPYFVGIILLTVFNLHYIFQNSRNLSFKLLSGLFAIVMSLCFFVYGYSEFSKLATPFDKWFVHYSNPSAYANVIKELAGDGSELLVMPQDSLLYWESGLSPSSKYFFTLNIMYSDGFVEDVKNAFAVNKPDFWYLANDGAATNAFGEFFPEYTPIKKGGDNSFLMIKNSRLVQIEPHKWDAVNRWGFSKPD